jgi:predicted DNA-binding transcriptional regulator YafY
MAKRITPLERAARMLDLVPFIASHQGVPIGELAQSFGIEVEELAADLNALWMCGDSKFDLIDLEFDSGYVSIRNAETLNRVRSLNQQELISIAIGLAMIEKQVGQERSDLHQAIAELRKKLIPEETQIVDASPRTSEAISSILKSALESRRKVSIHYLSSTEDRKSERVVSPLHITQENNHEFLVAYCDTAQAQRTFRVDRISQAAIIDSTVSPSSQVDVLSSHQLVKTKAHNRARQIYEIFGISHQSPKGELEIPIFNDQWLIRAILSLAGSLEVISPPEIRAAVLSRANQVLSLYR